MALPASRGRDGILAAALEAYLEEQPALLRDLFLCCVSYWHLLMMLEMALLYLSVLPEDRAEPSDRVLGVCLLNFRDRRADDVREDVKRENQY